MDHPLVDCTTLNPKAAMENVFVTVIFANISMFPTGRNLHLWIDHLNGGQKYQLSPRHQQYTFGRRKLV
jgi:hypothetical protein